MIYSKVYYIFNKFTFNYFKRKFYIFIKRNFGPDHFLKIFVRDLSHFTRFLKISKFKDSINFDI